MLFSFSAETWSATITSWGRDNYNQVTSTPTNTGFTAIAGGVYHSLALASDGSIISWGSDGANQVTNTPAGTGFTAIAGGHSHSLALTSNGSIISWGSDAQDQVSNTPSGTGFTAIAGDGYHSLALATAVPLPASAWMGIVLLGAIGTMSVARRRLCAA